MKLENFYVIFWTTLVGLFIGVALVATMLHGSKQDVYGDIPPWETTITIPLDPQTVPGPAPEFPFPVKRMIDAWNMFAPITSAHAAQHKPDTDIPLTQFPFASPLKLWTIDQLATDSEHVACSATRTLPNTVVLKVTSFKTGAAELRLFKAGFRMSEDMPYQDGVISIDNMTFVQVVAKRVSEFETSIDLSELPLTQLANGKILRVTINGYFIEFDLTGSANAAKYVAMCNQSGQRMVHERIVAAAQPAVVLETTSP